MVPALIKADHPGARSSGAGNKYVKAALNVS
jgi:hypothetical protein